jgi:hypothetical protein
MGVVEYKGSTKSLDGVVFEMYPVGCFDEGCASCCTNCLWLNMTMGTHLCCAANFTMTIAEDGKTGVGKNATLAGCLPMSPIPCCLCCGFGPLAFVSPFKIEDAGDGNEKWVGTGQVCAGGCCPCLVNTGDWGLNSPESDGSTPAKAHGMYPVSPFWPPCMNGMCCGKDKVLFKMTQKGVGKPTKKGGGPAAAEMQR